MAFSHLGLSAKVLSAIETAGYKTPTPIQDQAIPHVLARRDVLGIAQTGTGKTAAFLVALYQRLLTNPSAPGRSASGIRALILAPTRELAVQIFNDAETVAQIVSHEKRVAVRTDRKAARIYRRAIAIVAR